MALLKRELYRQVRGPEIVRVGLRRPGGRSRGRCATHGAFWNAKQAKKLISLNTTVRPRSIFPRCEKAFTRMSKDMTDKQQNAVALQRLVTSPGPNSNQTAEERRVQDALEDDEIREALELLHARGKNRRDEVV
jgi:hypothetical protein